LTTFNGRVTPISPVTILPFFDTILPLKEFHIMNFFHLRLSPSLFPSSQCIKRKGGDQKGGVSEKDPKQKIFTPVGTTLFFFALRNDPGTIDHISGDYLRGGIILN
jgi:hypothetical protein